MPIDENLIPENRRLSAVSLSADGDSLILENSDGEVFLLEIDESLRANISGNLNSDNLNSGNLNLGNLNLGNEENTSSHSTVRATALHIVRENEEMSVKEVQARLRAGETAAQIASGNWTLEKIEKFSGPIFQERAYIIAQAHKLEARKLADAAGNRTLLAATEFILAQHGVELAEIEWNTHRKEFGEWIITLTFPNKTGKLTAQWAFDINKGSLLSLDEQARWICGEEEKPKAPRPAYGYLATTPTEQERPTFEYPAKPPKLIAIKSERITENTIELDFSNSASRSVTEIKSVADEVEVSERDFTDDAADEKSSFHQNVAAKVDESDFSQDEADYLAESDFADLDSPESESEEPRVKLPSWDEMIFGKKEE